LGAAVGNVMQWYDLGVYSYLATLIAQVFYPDNTAGATNLVATFGTQAVAFAVRPLGGFIFGPLGDRIGRKPMLVITVLLMTAGTAATGSLPGYQSIDIWAPVLLIAIRILAALSAGGEYVGAMVYVSEHAPDRRRGMMAGFLPMGSLSGYVAAATLVTALQTALPTAEMLSWGWRIPFLLGVPLGLVALYLRLRIEESPAYEDMTESEGVRAADGKQQFKRTVVRQWKPLLVCIGLVATYNLGQYMFTGYLPTYLKKVMRNGDTTGLVMILVVQIILLATVVFLARLSDSVGRKPIMWVGYVLLIVVSIPAFLLIRFGGGYPMAFAGVLLIGVALLCFDSVEPSLLPALFPTGVRYGALAIGFNISMSAVGGTAPLVAQWLISVTGSMMVPAYMLIVAATIGVVALWFTPETAGKPLPGFGTLGEAVETARDVAEKR
jgi:MHS family proline/betaine transporter-like MFS transporter